MLWTPRNAGRITPVRPPSMMLPFGVAGTEPIGYHSRIAGAPTITRAGVRYHRNGASYVSVAENKHACETDGDGKRYVSVYGERTNSMLYSSAATGWTLGGSALTDSGVASPVSGVDWLRLAETNAAATWHGFYRSGSALAQNQRMVMQALFARGDRYITMRAWTGTSLMSCSLMIDPADWSITDTAEDGMTLHAYGVIPVGSGALVWLVCSDPSAVPGDALPFIGLSNATTFPGADTFVTYNGDPTNYPLGALCANMQICIGATGPGPLIETAAAAVTKAADVVSWPVADFGITGSVEMHARTRDTVPTSKWLWTWYDAGASSAFIGLALDAAGHVHLYTSNDDGSSLADVEVATAINDGAWHPIVASWGPDYVRLRVGDTDAIDTSVTMPTLANLTACSIGASGAVAQFDGDIAEFRAHTRRVI